MSEYRVRTLSLILVVLFSCLAATQNPQPQPTTLPVGSATVGEFKGEVSIRSPQGAALTTARGLVLEAESTIEVGKGSILLNLADGSQVLVKGHSKVVLKNPSQDQGFSLQLMIGKIVAKIQKRLGNAPSFRMGTPTAVITVRGTRFSVEVNKKHRTTVQVFDGVVQVEGLGPAAGAPVLVRPGFATGVQENRAPDRPHEIMENLHENDRRAPGMGGDLERQGPERSGSQPGGQNQQENEPH